MKIIKQLSKHQEALGMKRCAIYARVSTPEQRIDNQLYDLRNSPSNADMRSLASTRMSASAVPRLSVRGSIRCWHYAKITPLKIAKPYADAGYFARNLRAIEVLVDQEVVRGGHAATEPWKFYDLGHGYCTYDFFEQCQHRMACAKCDFYMPKQSTAALLLEGKTHLLRLLQEFPLGEAEQAAVEDGVSAYENLLSKLADLPTPAGPTQRQIGAELVQITSVRRALHPLQGDMRE